MITFSQQKAGFTVIELMVSVSIFAFITAFLAIKYGDFSDNVVITSAAYDVALAIRQAQTYELNVRSSSATVDQFNYPHGVYFQRGTNHVISFLDVNRNGAYEASPDIVVTDAVLRRGIFIEGICNNANSFNVLGCANGGMSFSFRRPYPDAIIYTQNGNSYGLQNTGAIWLTAGSATFRQRILVRSSGQISVE
jgi:prepilin-type N-terminal cleavage/methylation domain-containing protein